MHLENRVDKQKALQTYQEIKDLYQKLEAKVFEIEQDKNFFDMVYTANIGTVHNNIFIPANFKFAQRRGESSLGTKYFENKGFQVQKIPETVFFEGQGDLLTSGNRYFLGYGKRTDKKAKDYLEEILGEEITTLEMIDPYYYHLDTAFAPLSDDTVVINPKSFTKDGLDLIKKSFDNVIETNQQDNNILACNLIHIDNNIVIGKGISQSLKDDLSNHGYLTYEIDMKEYLKGGGSIKCVSFEF